MLLLLKVCIGEIKVGVVKFVYLIVLVLERVYQWLRRLSGAVSVSPRSSPAGEVSERNVPSGEERETDVSAGYVRGDVGLGRICVLLPNYK